MSTFSRSGAPAGGKRRLPRTPGPMGRGRGATRGVRASGQQVRRLTSIPLRGDGGHGRCRARILIVTALLSVSSSAQSAAKTNAERNAERYVRLTAIEVLAILRDKSLGGSERAARLTPILIRQVDLAYLGPWLLGRWRGKLKPADRAAYARALPRYLARTFAKRLAKDRGQVFLVKYAEAMSNGTIIVTSHLIDRDDPLPLVIKWRVHRGARGYKVRDLMVQNISMALTLRREFQALLERHDGDPGALLELLQGRRGQ
jgi:phospholipid transport system substrate-binding protein